LLNFFVMIYIYGDHELQFLKIYEDNCSIVMIRRQICEQHASINNAAASRERLCMKRTAEDLFSTPTNSSNTATTIIRRTICVHRLRRSLATGDLHQGIAANVEDLRHQIGELSSQLELALPLDSSNGNPVLELDWRGTQLDQHESAFFESLSQLGDGSVRGGPIGDVCGPSGRMPRAACVTRRDRNPVHFLLAKPRQRGGQRASGGAAGPLGRSEMVAETLPRPQRRPGATAMGYRVTARQSRGRLRSTRPRKKKAQKPGVSSIGRAVLL
jgi:hypothetical protein